jgi:mono/diheme cytochrome c family protein
VKIKIFVITGFLALISALYGAAPPSTKGASKASAAQSDADSDVMRLEGEQRFRANCGRCHAPPHKFPPRMMTTIVRHMRVRATITDEDMRLILYYMTR